MTQPISRIYVLHLAWPIILSNLSTPLLGLVDTAVIGNLGNASLLGAIAIGSVIFSFLFWGFGFLRMGTTALVAQAQGAWAIGTQNQHLHSETSSVFYRAAALAITIGLLFILFKAPVELLAFELLGASAEVESAAREYFSIRILGAPFSLLLLAVMGYLLGMQETKLVLYLNLLLNGMNIVLDLVFVVGLDLDVQGVALATVISEVTATLVGLLLVLNRIKRDNPRDDNPVGKIKIAELLSPAKVKRMFVVNRDIMIRTLCLIFAFAWFTDQGATQGDVTLAANAILMQFVTFAAFFLDGFALASETLVGNAVGSQDSNAMSQSIQYAFELGGITALVTSVAFFISGSWIIDLLTNVEAVRAAAREYLVWAIAAPIVSVWCYLLDGIFIGATKTIEMRNAMIASLLIYLGVWWFVTPELGNHGLWLALHSYFVARAITLGAYMPRLTRQLSQ